LKAFTCSCGQSVFFENTHCFNCGSTLAYDYSSDQIQALKKNSDGSYVNKEGARFKMCANYHLHDACNVCISEDDQSDWCIACSLNETIPHLENANNLHHWKILERAKRRLIRSLLKMGLSLNNHYSLRFAFMEDQSRNPNVHNEFVYTGHANGLITVNLDEADDLARENMKLAMGEKYRTPLGHLRHESGHYYFDALILNTPKIEEFRALFGDERSDYKKSLEDYYDLKKYQNNDLGYISHYAKSHPVEDWAETWAHYLHMYDTLETARSLDAIDEGEFESLDQSVADWANLIVLMNELNRSMGLSDAYPFVLSDEVIKKLNFVHQVIDPIS